jgi:hypothetical protein
VLEPLAAPLDGVEEVLGEVLAEPLALDEPPEAESFFVVSVDEEELEDEDGGVLGVAPAELEDEEGGVLGFTVTEPDAEDEPDGAVAEPDGGVVVEPLEEEDDAPGWVVRALSPALSPQAVSTLAPKIIDTATAKVESLMLWASLVGVRIRKQGTRLSR